MKAKNIGFRVSRTARNVAIGVALVSLASCSVPKDVAYFQDASPSALVEMVERTPIKVRPGDKLAIVVKTRDPQVAALFNLPVYSNRIGQAGSVSGTGAQLRSYQGATSESVASYTVSPQGTIDFPMLGDIKVEGMTRAELSAYIKGEIIGRELAKDPTVVVEFLSVGINILGQVGAPGRYDLNRDDINVLEALALAGDLNINGQRKNVKVLRKENGKIQTYVLDLTDMSSTSKSPAFYLRQDDIVYVEPNDMTKRLTTTNGNNFMTANFWLSVTSVMTSIVTTIAVLRR